MTITNNQGARILTRDELLSRLGGAVRTKTKRDKFERGIQLAVAQAAHWSGLEQIRAVSR